MKQKKSLKLAGKSQVADQIKTFRKSVCLAEMFRS